jgi:hypothetical protein
MQANIFKITMKSNVTTMMEAPIHVNPLTTLENIKGFLHLEAFILGLFQVDRDNNSANVGVSGR